jgi:release factor glutamine methyltransferase
VNLSALVVFVSRSFETAGVISPRVDAEILVSYALGIKRSKIYLEPQSLVAPSQEAAVMRLAREREQRVPLQYITGECELMSLPFKVPRGVFIPRPETEVLIEALLDKAGRMKSRPRRLIDLGTGSGVIGVSLAKYLEPDVVVASDLSPLAVRVAAENSMINGVADRMAFVIGKDLGFLKIAGYGHRQIFDIVASNPPYVESGQIDLLDPEVKDHEPRIAIDGGEDGLRFFERIVPEVSSILREGGLAGFEIGEAQADRLRGLFEAHGFKQVEIVKDIAGKDRVILGRAGWTR